MKFEAEGKDFRAVDSGDGHDRLMSPPLEFEGNGDERIDVAEGADVGKKDAHEGAGSGNCLP